MKYRYLITSIRKNSDANGLRFYCFNDGEKNVYCTALSSAEAGCKYILSNYEIDMIMTFGSKSTFHSENEMNEVLLNEGESFHTSNLEDMSAYNIFRYRLSEYMDEVDAEMQDVRAILNDEEQDWVEQLIKNYFRSIKKPNSYLKFNRFFELLVKDELLYSDMEEKVSQAAQEKGLDPETVIKWIRVYLYQEYRENRKMQLLESNEDVELRFVCSGDDESSGEDFADLLIEYLEYVSNTRDDEEESMDLFLCMEGDNTRDTFVLTSLTDTLRTMSGPRVNVVKTVIAESVERRMVTMLQDYRGWPEITDLLSASRAFLRYGKTDLLIDFRNEARIQNQNIDHMIYAMKNIDIGISLCDVTDIERGINSLKKFFKEGQKIEGDTFAEKYFNVIALGIKQDFGPLLQGEQIEFIELVKWAFRKEFWQQTLTLIESRAPRDFVEKGIFCYCLSSEDRENIVQKFGEIYYDLKPYEKYKLEDVAHYFVKFYNRRKTPYSDDNKAYQLDYARNRIKELDPEDAETIKAYTLCKDTDTLTELLFAYYYLGDVRNSTNHAIDEFSGFLSVMADSDVSERMNLIRQTVQYFIYSYDKVLGIIKEQENKPEAVQIETAELVEYAKKLRYAAREERRKN